MNRRGVCYDVGRVLWGQDWRPEFSSDEARRELQIIRDDLHCNAVRICGQDLGRLLTASRHALDCGLEVWLSPELWNHGPGETLTYIGEAAEAAAALHRHRPGHPGAYAPRPGRPRARPAARQPGPGAAATARPRESVPCRSARS